MTSQATALQQALHGALADPAIARLLRRLPLRLQLCCGDTLLPVAVAPGAVAPDLAADSGERVTVAAPDDVWAAMLLPLPPPGRQSAGAAMRARCGFELRGQPLPIAQSLPLIEALIERMRATPAHPEQAEPNGDRQVDGDANRADLMPALERIGSRYLAIDWPPGQTSWVFEESSGDTSQPVLLLMHTAGADSRQWHSLMCDPQLGAHWRMVAFDMPCHGRSPPPAGWAGESWQLETGSYLAAIDGWMKATGTSKVAIAGCSMGAAIGLVFVARRPAAALGAILLEAPWHSPGRRTPMLDSPAVHGGRFGAAWVQALLSPHSPAHHRRFATWIYSQAAPGVYEGDLAFYSDEFDASHYVVDIDTRVTPLWLMTGDYDYSASPADSRRIAEAVAGATFIEMSGLGHFPMTENPQRLLSHFRPAALALRRMVDATGREET